MKVILNSSFGLRTEDGMEALALEIFSMDGQPCAF